MRTDYIHKEELQHILAALMPPNRLALEISLATGLRIGDVLAIKSEQLNRTADQRITVREQKTGKNRRVRIPLELFLKAIAMSGRVYVFEHRHDWRKHRTRQAVYKDIKRAAKLFRISANVAPHTARKVYAVEQYNHHGQDLKRVQRLLNHTEEGVTMLYAMADQLTHRRLDLGSGK